MQKVGGGAPEGIRGAVNPSNEAREDAAWLPLHKEGDVLPVEETGRSDGTPLRRAP